MNLSLRKRVSFCFIIANAVILFTMVMVYYYLDGLRKNVQNIMEQSLETSVLTDQVRVSTVNLMKSQRKLLVLKDKSEIVEDMMIESVKLLTSIKEMQIKYQEPEFQKTFSKMEVAINDLKTFLGKGNYVRNSTGLETINRTTDKILDEFADYLTTRKNTESSQLKMDETIMETKRHMMITLIIGFLGCILLTMIVPGKIALPFKKINDAIRELQDCNFDVSIYYNQDDEIGEISREMNKMIMSMKKFEELRSNRISVEHRKFDALANLIKKPVLIANADSKIIYMNNKLYEILQVQSDEVLNKHMVETHLPESIIHVFELAIKRRSKIENAEVLIPRKIFEEDEDATSEESADQEDGEEEAFYRGYANVIPIRGKESSLDYYLMVMSTQVFA